MKRIEFETLKGKTLKSIEGAEKGSETIIFETTGGDKFEMYHQQDCCESVSVEDVIGDISDLIGSEILLAEEVENRDIEPGKFAESYTWTFYKLSTIRGSVTLRWYGESNGYYSESVDFEQISEVL